MCGQGRARDPDGTATGARTGAAAVSDLSVDVRTAPGGLGRGGRPIADTVTEERPPHASVLQVVGIVVLLGVLAIGVPVFVASHYGALGIPRSDDWSCTMMAKPRVSSIIASVRRPDWKAAFRRKAAR